MKINLVFLLFSTVLCVSAQVEKFNTLLEKGKAEFFRKEGEQSDYAEAARCLEKALALKPNHAEAHYFLGYAYSRLNTVDGETIMNAQRAMTEKASAQFEATIRRDPAYDGPYVVLDPYSKLSSEWASLAIHYLYIGRQDSAVWAFQEGKKRGGFSEYYLGICRVALDLCQENAILLSSGDNFTFPLLYLQWIDGYRKDVAIIDVNLLNAKWYAPFLVKNNVISLTFDDNELDSLSYCVWEPHTVTIQHFSWQVPSTYESGYLMLGDRFFLNMLESNKFKKPIYFMKGVDKNQQLGLSGYTESMILVKRVNYDGKQLVNNDLQEIVARNILTMTDLLHPGRADEMILFNSLRADIWGQAAQLFNNDQSQQAKVLADLVQKYANGRKLPYPTKEWKKFVKIVIKRIEKIEN